MMVVMLSMTLKGSLLEVILSLKMKHLMVLLLMRQIFDNDVYNDEDVDNKL